MRKPIFIAIIYLIIIAVAAVLVYPTFQKFMTISQMVSQKEKELASLEDYLSHLKKISLQLQEYAPQLAKIDQALSRDAYLPNLFYFCQKLAAASGVSLDYVGLGVIAPLKDKENIKKREANIKVSGSYLNFKNFLTSLEKSTRLIEVTKIYFSSKSVKEVPKFDLMLKIHSY